MRRLSLAAALALCFCLIAGCSLKTSRDTNVSAGAGNLQTAATSQTSTAELTNYEKYIGNWGLKVSEDEELYLMTALDVYYGSTGIDINEISNGHVKGNIYSISGAPSYRQAEVPFEGDIVNGKLTASYKDEGWLYSGEIELIFAADKITANITREKSDNPSLWGIPEGQFTFLRTIKTETVTMSDDEKNQLTKFLSVITKDRIKPFDEGSLTDETIIDFIGLNLGLGTMDVSEFADRIKSTTDVVFDKSVMNDISVKYFGVEIKNNKSTDIVKYDNGVYTVPELGGISEYPIVQMLMKDDANEGTYYAIVDYMIETPAEATHLEYQYLVKLQKSDGYKIKSIKEIKSPIDFELLKSVQKNTAVK